MTTILEQIKKNTGDNTNHFAFKMDDKTLANTSWTVVHFNGIDGNFNVRFNNHNVIELCGSFSTWTISNVVKIDKETARQLYKTLVTIGEAVWGQEINFDFDDIPSRSFQHGNVETVVFSDALGFFQMEKNVPMQNTVLRLDETTIVDFANSIRLFWDIEVH